MPENIEFAAVRWPDAFNLLFFKGFHGECGSPYSRCIAVHAYNRHIMNDLPTQNGQLEQIKPLSDKAHYGAVPSRTAFRARFGSDFARFCPKNIARRKKLS
jgi:hypothetical protein